MRIYTMGFTKKPARRFFGLLQEAGPRRVIDVRLNNLSQLAGFTKKDDLEYFLEVICHIGYEHLLILAPSEEILNEYKRNGGDWRTYERSFLRLLKERQVETKVPRELVADSCLLCSEDSPARCHRRLVAEYLAEQWGDIEIVHLK